LLIFLAFEDFGIIFGIQLLFLVLEDFGIIFGILKSWHQFASHKYLPFLSF